MSGFRLKYAAVTGQFAKAMDEARKPIAEAATLAINDAGEWAKTMGRANIAAAGFSQRWQNALRVNYYPQPSRAKSLHPAAFIYHRIPYAGVFEQGATITGSHLLWLPLPNVPTTAFGKHMSPKVYMDSIGPLRLVYRAGKPPVLVGVMAGGGNITVAKLVAGNRAAKRQTGARVRWVPLFFGLDRVTLAKRFDLGPIFEKAASMLGDFYLKNLKVK